MSAPHSASEGTAAPVGNGLPLLLDERSRPDFRSVYGLLVSEASGVDVAIRKVRLSGMSLGRKELEGPQSIRLLLAEINVLTLSSEAEILAASAEGRRRVQLLRDLLSGGALHVRSAPLGGWAPDFSVFRLRRGDIRLLVGPHWFARPYPHRGPALASLHSGSDAAYVSQRFEAVWRDAHPVDAPVARVLSEALERVPPPPSDSTRGAVEAPPAAAP